LAWLRLRHRRYSQSDLDRAAGWARQTTAQIEGGHRPPPSRAECDRLDELLGLEPGAVWAAALPVHVARARGAIARRLAHLDPEVAAQVLAQPRPQQVGVEPNELGSFDDRPALDLVPPHAVTLDADPEP